MKKPSSKHRRFYYHYFRQKGKLSFHFGSEKCIIVDNIICVVPCESKWSEKQPNLVMQGWAESYVIENNVVTIK